MTVHLGAFIPAICIFLVKEIFIVAVASVISSWFDDDLEGVATLLLIVFLTNVAWAVIYVYHITFIW